MRSRNLKPSFFRNETIGRLPPFDRLLFAGLWCLCDREGFFEMRPDRIAADLFPYDKKIDAKEIMSMTSRLMSCHVITYLGGYGYVPSFLKHNNPHPHEAKSTVPEKIKKNLINQCNDMSLQVMTCKGQAGLNPESLLLNPESKTLAQNGSFERFWSAYPKKVGKAKAIVAFKKIDPQNGMIERILSAIDKQSKTDQWLKDGGQYIPHPTTWLNGRRWEDEILSPEDIAKRERERQEDEYARKHGKGSN